MSGPGQTLRDLNEEKKKGKKFYIGRAAGRLCT